MSAATLQSPLRDLIAIPERVDASDFVLQLHAGVSNAERTLRDYVVTPAIAGAINDALGLAASTLDDGLSKGAFIHGSFGSGKSHFMAVLHLLLSGNTAARSIDGLQAVIAQRQSLLERRFLAIDYHLMGKSSLEQALFQGYLDAVAERHPNTALPVLHNSDALMHDAVELRGRMGDAAFFGALPSSGGSGWGDLATGWDSASFDAAVASPLGSEERSRLARDLISVFFGGYERAGEWLDIESGLRAMTAHAQSLGYDTVVLLLDELVLWLGQHLSDTAFIQREAGKVAKLVEVGSGVLPVPLVSFIARQRDLKDFIGSGRGLGAEQVAIADSFQWWEDRFSRIDLQAADLPKIVKQRLLAPISIDAENVLTQAVHKVKNDGASWGFLLSDSTNANEATFADVYPFSPAIVDAMIALSSLMQRERTALKIMSEMLSAGRDDLTVSDVIPAGDLFDFVVGGSSKPLTADMQRLFENSRHFYAEKMRPHLLAKYRLSEDAARALPRNAPFRTEDRLAKTLLLAQIAPGTASLRTLTAGKLAALNYGTIASFIPGQESQQALSFAREWAQQFGEISVGEGHDPVITMSLSGVDYDSIIDRVRTEDSADNRQQLIRSLVAAELHLPESGLLRERQLTHTWRGQKRTVSVLFGNVRDAGSVSDADLVEPPAGQWRLVIDFPYDPEPARSPNDDIARLDKLRASGANATTIAWVPNFLTSARLEDLGKLVLLEHVLKPTQFEANSSHLSPSDALLAKDALENQRRSLRDSIVAALRQAYGVSSAKGDVDVQLQGPDIFSTLFPGLTIQQPVTDSLLRGIQSVLGKAWDAEYPDHPKFEPSDREVTRNELQTAVDLVARTVENGGRLENFDNSAKNVLRRIATPLRQGTHNDNVFVAAASEFGWHDAFTRAFGSRESVSVSEARASLDDFGLTTQVTDTVLLTWALVDNREWARGGRAIDRPAVGSLASDMEIRRANLPDEETWRIANERANGVLGVTKERVLAPGAVRRLGNEAIRAAKANLAPAEALVAALDGHLGDLRLAADSGRVRTARAVADLLARVSAESDALIALQHLAVAGLPEVSTMKVSLTNANEVARAIGATRWESLAQAATWAEDEVDRALAALYDAASREEYAAHLGPALKSAGDVVHHVALKRAGGSAGGGDTEQSGDGDAKAGGGTASGGSDTSTGGSTPDSRADAKHYSLDDLDTRLPELAELIRSAGKGQGKSQVTISWRFE